MRVALNAQRGDENKDMKAVVRSFIKNPRATGLTSRMAWSLFIAFS